MHMLKRNRELFLKRVDMLIKKGDRLTKRAIMLSLPVHVSVPLFIQLFHISPYLSIYLSIYISIYMYICLSIFHHLSSLSNTHTLLSIRIKYILNVHNYLSVYTYIVCKTYKHILKFCFLFQATAIRAVSLGDGRLGSALDILHRSAIN